MHIVKNLDTFIFVIHSFSMHYDIFFDKSALKVRLECVLSKIDIIFEFSIKFWIYCKKLRNFNVCYLQYHQFIAKNTIPLTYLT